MNNRKKRYNLLYLPAGKLLEIRGLYTDKSKWHLISKNRSDLRGILNRILNRKFAPIFYIHNEITIPFDTLKNYHFSFQQVELKSETDDVATN